MSTPRRITSTLMKSFKQRIGPFVALWLLFVSCAESIPQQAGGWDALPAILKNIQAPVFPERDFDITLFGAIGDGTTNCTEAFKKAIEECNRVGGGEGGCPSRSVPNGSDPS